MGKIVKETESVCPVCFRKIPAQRVEKCNNVYLEKVCRDHGQFRALIWRGADLYQNWGQRHDQPIGPQKATSTSDSGCPYDCGLCTAHEVGTCTAVMELTHRCNLECPTCFASANEDPGFEPGIDTVMDMYRTIEDTSGLCPVQLSGGEPTIREDLPEVVAFGKKMGFYHIQINTNGIRIADDKVYLNKLKENGADLIFLQFDGVSNDVYRALRGRDLFDTKMRAIKNCGEAEIGVILVPTLVPRVNDHQIGDIVQFAKERIPVVKGIHFQPVTYLGRYPAPPEDEDRMTLPDVLNGLLTQTNGEIKSENILPRSCDDTHCSFSGLFVLMEDGKLQARSNAAWQPVSGFGYDEDSPEVASRRFIDRRWRWVNEEAKRDTEPCNECLGRSQGAWQRFLKREKSYYLTISCMPFQDIYTLDLERLRKCCVHVVGSSNQLIPFCAFYATSIKGERLYQNPAGRMCLTWPKCEIKEEI